MVPGLFDNGTAQYPLHSSTVSRKKPSHSLLTSITMVWWNAFVIFPFSFSMLKNKIETVEDSPFVCTCRELFIHFLH